MTTHQTPRSTCPCCSAYFSACSGIDHSHAPKPGDFSVCIQCAAVLRFLADLTIAEVSNDDIDSLDPLVRDQLTYARSVVLYRNGHRATADPAPT